MRFIKLFYFSDYDKKNVAGHAEVYLLSAGESDTASKDLNAKIVMFYLLKTGLISDIKIVLFGFANGY